MHSDLLLHLTKATARERSAPSFTPDDDAPTPLGWAASPIIALRLARADDARALADLAALDDAPQLIGPALLAVVDGRPVAAGSLADGRVVADPFVATGDALALLRLRMDTLGRPSPRRRRWPRLGPARLAW